MYDYPIPINKSNNDCIGCYYYSGICNYQNICMHKPMPHFSPATVTTGADFIGNEINKMEEEK